MKEELLKLADRVEALSGPDREVDERISLAIGLPATVTIGHEVLGNLRQVPHTIKRYTASLDAAMTLVPEGCAFGCGHGTNDAEIEGWAWCGPDEGPYSFAATPALAVCAAALRALAKEE